MGVECALPYSWYLMPFLSYFRKFTDEANGLGNFKVSSGFFANKYWEMGAFLPENKIHFLCFETKNLRRTLHYFSAESILVPRGCDPFGQRHGSRPLGGRYVMYGELLCTQYILYHFIHIMSYIRICTAIQDYMHLYTAKHSYTEQYKAIHT